MLLSYLLQEAIVQYIISKLEQLVGRQLLCNYTALDFFGFTTNVFTAAGCPIAEIFMVSISLDFQGLPSDANLTIIANCIAILKTFRSTCTYYNSILSLPGSISNYWSCEKPGIFRYGKSITHWETRLWNCLLFASSLPSQLTCKLYLKDVRSEQNI